jgi:hypothetical protein
MYDDALLYEPHLMPMLTPLHGLFSPLPLQLTMHTLPSIHKIISAPVVSLPIPYQHHGRLHHTGLSRLSIVILPSRRCKMSSLLVGYGSYRTLNSSLNLLGPLSAPGICICIGAMPPLCLRPSRVLLSRLSSKGCWLRRPTLFLAAAATAALC